MRYAPGESSSVNNTWQGHKQQGREYYEEGDYEEALTSYRAALNPDFRCPAVDAQIIRSNICACRLKIGGSAQADAAVQDAKQCIEMNPSWAKGHVRLASAYIALGGHSNDACNSLQTALRLDSGNQLARQMLLRELRRDHAASSSASNPPQEGNYDGLHDDVSGASGSRRRQQQAPENPYLQAPVDDALSLTDRCKFYAAQIQAWYHAQTYQSKLIIRGLLIMLVLYMAFGGRFGLDSVFSRSTPTRRGNYGAGNAYEQYYRHGRRDTTSSNSNNQYDYHNSANRPHRTSTTTSSSFQWPNLFDGSLPSMVMLAGVAFLCRRNGINPFHAFWFANIFAGGRRARGGGGGGGGGGLYNMGGFGGYGGRGMGWGRGRRGRW